MHPSSAPDYYDKLEKELDEAPNVTWLGSLKKKLAGMIRLK